MTLQRLVTKDWLRAKLWLGAYDPAALTPNAAVVVGRALTAINARQDADERGVALKLNGRGFAKPDANLGHRCATHYQHTGTLLPWMLLVWVQPTKNGYPRICKYVEQLNIVANERLCKDANVQG